MLSTLVLLAVGFTAFSVLLFFKDLVAGIVLAIPAAVFCGILLGYWMGYNHY